MSKASQILINLAEYTSCHEQMRTDHIPPGRYLQRRLTTEQMDIIKSLRADDTDLRPDCVPSVTMNSRLRIAGTNSTTRVFGPGNTR